jgi:hypothetical protein
MVITEVQAGWDVSVATTKAVFRSVAVVTVTAPVALKDVEPTVPWQYTSCMPRAFTKSSMRSAPRIGCMVVLEARLQILESLRTGRCGTLWFVGRGDVTLVEDRVRRPRGRGMARLRRSSASFLVSWVEEALLCIRWPSLASQMHARSDGHGAAPSKA